MVDVFLKIVNMSISASWLVLAVLVFRLVFKKAPKWIHVLLWGIVAVRLLCPFSIESALSLIPSAETISPEIMMSREPTIHTGVPAINSVVNPIITETFAPEPVASANPLQILIPVLAMIWGIGVALLLAYTAISYWRLRRRVRMAVLLRDNIYQSEAVSSPFVLGIIKPKIYLPFRIDGQNLEHVVSHEQAHIGRRDHWWKPLGFLLLTIHWFNPMMWLAYVLLCRDIELACDEKVVKELGKDQRADYSQALLACSVNRRMIAACPLAFGEVGVKERVKSVINYKKPAFWVIVVSVIACAVVAVCFLTNPLGNPDDLPQWFENDDALLEHILENVEADGKDIVGGTYLMSGVETGGAGFKKYRVYTADGSEYVLTAKGKYRRQALITGPYGPGLRVTDISCAPVSGTSGKEEAPVMWTYSPMMSATWHAALHINFDLSNYTHVEASCDNGTLWNLQAQGQPRDKTMRFEKGEPLCWMPGVGDSLTDTAENAKVTFTVYDGGEIVEIGVFDIVRTGTDNGQSFYQAELTDTLFLTLKQESGSFGASVILAGNGNMVSYSDINHNRINERVIVQEVAPGMLYELCVLENGTLIWAADAAPAHTGWNTIMHYEENGESYFVEYQPAMFQGVGSYRCTVFSLDGGEKVIHKEWTVDFELPIEETPEMTRFAEEVGVLLRKCSVLLSTEQGILVDQWTAASSLPQLYPVRFDPDEILQAIEAAADPTAPQELTANAAAFPTESLEFVFASGAGGWGTYLTLQPDGRFTGDYGDSDMDTRYECKFEGQFTDIQQISDYCWAMKLGDVTIEKEEGTTWTEDGIHYIAAGPYGVSDGTDFLLYAPGTPADLIPAACRDWWPDAYRWRNGEIDILNGWGLCNLNEGTAFYTTWLQ